MMDPQRANRASALASSPSWGKSQGNSRGFSWGVLGARAWGSSFSRHGRITSAQVRCGVTGVVDPQRVTDRVAAFCVCEVRRCLGGHGCTMSAVHEGRGTWEAGQD